MSRRLRVEADDLAEQARVQQAQLFLCRKWIISDDTPTMNHRIAVLVSFLCFSG